MRFPRGRAVSAQAVSRYWTALGAPRLGTGKASRGPQRKGLGALTRALLDTGGSGVHRLAGGPTRLQERALAHEEHRRILGAGWCKAQPNRTELEGKQDRENL